MRSVHESAYYTVGLDEDRVVHLVRTAEAWGSLDQAQAETNTAVAAIREVLGDSGRGRGLLMDFREARSRNDEPFEKTMAQYSEATRDNFERVAIVVRSTVGRMQMQRLNQGADNAPQVFDDPSAATAWLRGEG